MTAADRQRGARELEKQQGVEPRDRSLERLRDPNAGLTRPGAELFVRVERRAGKLGPAASVVAHRDRRELPKRTNGFSNTVKSTPGPSTIPLRSNATVTNPPLPSETTPRAGLPGARRGQAWEKLPDSRSGRHRSRSRRPRSRSGRPEIAYSMPEAWIASITSPEQGAQQECRSSRLRPSGNFKASRWNVIVNEAGAAGAQPFITSPQPMRPPALPVGWVVRSSGLAVAATLTNETAAESFSQTARYFSKRTASSVPSPNAR